MTRIGYKMTVDDYKPKPSHQDLNVRRVRHKSEELRSRDARGWC